MRTSLTRQVGSVVPWVIARLFQGFILFGCLESLRSHQIWLKLALAGMFALFTYLFYPLSCGIANMDGVTFRRYFKRHHVAWDQVLDVQWDPNWDISYLRLKLARPRALSDKVEFTMIEGATEFVGAFARGWMPEIVLWVTDRVRHP